MGVKSNIEFREMIKCPRHPQPLKGSSRTLQIKLKIRNRQYPPLRGPGGSEGVLNFTQSNKNHKN